MLILPKEPMYVLHDCFLRSRKWSSALCWSARRWCGACRGKRCWKKLRKWANVSKRRKRSSPSLRGSTYVAVLWSRSIICGTWVFFGLKCVYKSFLALRLFFFSLELWCTRPYGYRGSGSWKTKKNGITEGAHAKFELVILKSLHKFRFPPPPSIFHFTPKVLREWEQNKYRPSLSK